MGYGLIDLVGFGGALKNNLLIFLPSVLRGNLCLGGGDIGSSYTFGYCLYVQSIAEWVEFY